MEITYKVDRLKKTTLEMAKNVTTHGLPSVIRSERLSFKIMWLILLMVSSSTCIYYIASCFNGYFEYEYITSIRTIPEIPAAFPAISICSYNNPKFKFTVLSLYLDSRKLLDWKNHFEPFYDSIYGDCYRFNSGKNYTGHNVDLKRSTDPGNSYGLWLDLWLDSNDNDIGQFVIYIHNQTNTPRGLINKELFINTGNYNNFLIKRIFEEKLSEPYNTCYKDISLFPYNQSLIETFKERNQSYAQKECIKLCRILYFIEKSNCNCSIDYNDAILYKCILSNQDETSKNCTSDFFENFLLDNPGKLCENYCPLECDSFKIETFLFSQNMASTGNISQSFEYPDFKTYENVSKSFVSIFVYYDDLEYVLITQKPKMQIFDLVSNIGGLFGLFLGMSLLSFIELFEILIESFLIIFNK